MTMQEGLGALGSGTAGSKPAGLEPAELEPAESKPAGLEPAARRERAYFLDLLGDSHTGLGRHEAAIEAYRQAADGFKSQGAHCSYALCLWKVAEGHLSLGEPWHALGYLEASLPLLHELGLTRHAALAREQLAQCRSELAGVGLLTEDKRS